MKRLGHDLDKKPYIPADIAREAIEMFEMTRGCGRVFRKEHKWGVIGACIYHICMKRKITKTLNEIAHACEVHEKYISMGDRFLQSLNESGVITLSTKVNPISDYLDRYFAILGIDAKYKQFLVDLIARVEKKKLHLIYDSKNNTRCIGAVYILVTRIPALRAKISNEMIEKACGISKATFTKMYNMVHIYYRIFKKVFRIHKIPMPSYWKC